MSSLTVFDLLAMHDFVGDLPSDSLRRLAPAARPVFRPAGFRLFREDTPADRFWLVHSGVVALDLHVPGRGDVVIERLGAGSVVGWSWLVAPYRWRLGAVVAEEARAVELDAVRIRALIAEDPVLGPELTARFFAVVGERLHAARRRLIELYAYPADAA
jgi:CRP-like cAMP-binding protein